MSFKNNAKKVFFAYIIAIILMVVLPLNSAGELNDIFILRFRADYLLHSALFIPWPLFGIFMKKNTGLWIIYGLLFAVFSEGIQYFLPYRAFNINDLLANGMGVLLGSFFYLIFAILKKTRVP